MRRILLALLVASPSSLLDGESSQPTGRLSWEKAEGAEGSYSGLVQESAAEPGDQVVYLATPTRLYAVVDGKVEKPLEPPERGARLLLAPGGKVLAWLIPVRDTRGLRRAVLTSAAGEVLGRLMVNEFPRGFATLYLGFQGKAIITESPLEDPEALSGKFFYTFWDSSGKALEKVVFPGKQHVAVDGGGTSALFFDSGRATARSAAGQRIWEWEGGCRKAALGEKASLALLNPSARSEIDKVHILAGGKLAATVKVPTPVRDLRLAPDGSAAVVVGGGGRYFYLHPASGKLEEGPPLKVSGPFEISGVEFIPRPGLLAFGLLHREGEARPYTWPRASILAVDPSGRVAFERGIPVREATASVPAIDAAPGSFVGRTESAAMFVTFGQ